MIVLKIIGWILLSALALIIVALCIRVGVEVEYSSEQTAVSLRYLFLNLPLYPTQKKEGKEKKSKKKNDAAPAAADTPPEQTQQPEAAAAGTSESPAAENAPGIDEASATETTSADGTPEGETAEVGTTDTAAAPAAKKKDSFLKTLYEAEGIDGLITIVKKVVSYTKTFFGGAVRGVVVDQLWLEVCCTRSDAASTAIYYGEVCGILFPLLGGLASRCRIKKYDVNIYPDYLARFSSASFFVRFHITPIWYIGITLAYGMKMLFGVLVGMLVKLFLPKKEKEKQEIQIKSKEKRESK